MWTELTREFGDRLEMIEIDRDTPQGNRWAAERGLYGQPAFVVLTADGETTYRGYGPTDAEGVVRLVEAAAAGNAQ